jgi:hypothetical protein
MAHDYEDGINLDQMTDEDIRDLVRERLDQADDFEADTLDIEVADGRVRVEGRVGTEGERQFVDQVLTGLGAVEYDNNVIVDRLTRQERSEAADLASLEDAATTAPLGESGSATSDTAEHLLPDDLADMHGTRDMQKAIEEGKSYRPPDSPHQEGIGEGERH